MLQELQDVINGISAEVGVPTSLTDTRLNSLVFGPHDDAEIDSVRRQALLLRSTPEWVREWFGRYSIPTATAPVRIPADPERELASRVVVPARWASTTCGYICLLDVHQELDETRMTAVVEAAAEVGRVLYLHQQARRSDADLLVDLVRGSAAVRGKAVDRLSEQGRFPVGWPVAVVFLRPVGGGAGTDALEHWLWRDHGGLSRRALRCLDAEGAVILAAVPPTAESGHKERIVDHLLTGGDDLPEFVIGIGDPQSDLHDAHLSYEHARLAARAATVWPETGPVCSWDRLGALRVLIGTPDHLLRDLMDPRVALLAEAQSSQASLIDTLETYLDSGCDNQTTAARLHVHRGTVYYRLEKAASLCGMDLSDGLDRLALHLGIKLLRLIESKAG
ncbi:MULTISPECIES: CdaR family transcriptional regulator [unclassified Streptomyces]|uniref:PucR family transcriptional regulator n=1 Tax=unclassified Streptomyces TaxID=2593676 RepID=UPI000A9D0B67|nr:helix-turn-helix domain-containing protein [Streptomyces sp. CNQ-509]